MSSTHRWTLAVAAALLLAAPLSAQQDAHLDATPALVTSSLFATTPVDARLAFGTIPEAAYIVPVVLPGARGSERDNVALMIVGGAGLVVGALVDGDAGTIIMVGGGVVGLIGLYRYLR